MALQSEGKVLLVGAHLKENGLFESVLMRHDPDGSRDVGFGSNGLLLKDTADITNEKQFAFALVAYNPDGSLDGRFK